MKKQTTSTAQVPKSLAASLWEEKARSLQQREFVRLGDRNWDAIPVSIGSALLERKLAYGFFGPPTKLPFSGDIVGTGYNPKRQKLIRTLCDVILQTVKKDSGVAKVSFFFVVSGRDFKRTPVVKVFCEDEKQLFATIDLLSGQNRVFGDWEEFYSEMVKDSHAFLCIPQSGVYCCDTNKQCQLLFHPKIIFGLDFRKSTIQQGEQQNSLSLDEVTQLDLVTFLKREVKRGEASCHLTCKNPKGDIQEMQKALGNDVITPFDVTAFELAFSKAVNDKISIFGIMALTKVVQMAQNCSSDNDAQQLEHYQCASYFLFYTNLLVQQKMIETLVVQVQNKLIEMHKDGLKGHSLQVYMYLTGERNLNQVPSKIVRQVIHIWDKGQFYSKIKEIIPSLEAVSFSEKVPGLLSIKNDISVHPMWLTKSRFEEIELICKNRRDFENKVKTFYGKHMCFFDLTIDNARQELNEQAKKAFGVEEFQDIEIRGRKLFADMKPFMLLRLRETLERCKCKNDNRVLKIAKTLAELQCISEPNHFWSLLEFVNECVTERLKVMNACIKRWKDKERSELLHEFKESSFKCKYEIVGRDTEFCRNWALNEIMDRSNDDGIREMDFQFSLLRRKILPLNNTLSIRFADEYSAVYHYYKHRNWNSKELNPEDYFAKAKKLLTVSLGQNPVISQNGDFNSYIHEDKKSGAFGVTYQWHTPFCKNKTLATFYQKV